MSLILYVISLNTRFEVYTAGIITAFIGLLSLILIPITGKIRDNKNPKYIYESKLRDIDKAQKELEKFLVEHPEFREEQ